MKEFLGVIIVTYNSAAVIVDCLETLFGAAIEDDTPLCVVVVDNASTDTTHETIRTWAGGEINYEPPKNLPFKHLPVAKPINTQYLYSKKSLSYLKVISAKENYGFATGVNLGLEYLSDIPEIRRFWILNPDCAVPAGTPAAFDKFCSTPFSIMGGRLIYFEAPDKIQIDGGFINKFTGVTYNKNQYEAPNCAPPDPDNFDFISGACMVVSRTFYESVGGLSEDYFLYYEEVDWAQKRGDLPLEYCSDAIVYHRGGTSIGSPTPNRPASTFSLYFKHRARIRFMQKHYPKYLIIAFSYSCAKALQLILKGCRRKALTLMLASLNRPPPTHVCEMLSDKTAQYISSKHIQKD